MYDILWSLLNRRTVRYKEHQHCAGEHTNLLRRVLQVVPQSVRQILWELCSSEPSKHEQKGHHQDKYSKNAEHEHKGRGVMAAPMTWRRLQNRLCNPDPAPQSKTRRDPGACQNHGTVPHIRCYEDLRAVWRAHPIRVCTPIKLKKLPLNRIGRKPGWARGRAHGHVCIDRSPQERLL